MRYKKKHKKFVDTLAFLYKLVFEPPARRDDTAPSEALLMQRTLSSKHQNAKILNYIISAVTIFITCLLLTACPVRGPNLEEETDTNLLKLNVLSPEMIELADSLEPKVHDYLFNYVVSYNRVISLTNSVLLADLKKTSRQLLKDRSAAAVAEIDDLLKKCRDMETFAITELKPTLDEFAEKYPKQIAALSTKNAKAAEVDEWRARHLIEMMLDFEYGANFDLEKISRSTGVGMAKLKFLMDQTNRQLTTNIDIVDYQETDKEIARIEKIRDTANTVNSALSLINPVQAIIKGGATATAAAAAGWISKGKTAVAVVENSSALWSVTSGVVNLAVAQEDIPPTFKAISKANDYLGLVLGGKQGFTGANWGEKTVGIIGTASSSTTMYFEVKDEGVKVSSKPLVESTPADINPSVDTKLGGILPAGDYRIPDVSLDEWAYPDFDWGAAAKEQFWIDIYEGSSVAQSAVDEMVTLFDNFVKTWDETANNAKTKEAKAQSSSGVPGFFDDPDTNFPDPGDIGDAPVQEDFAVTLTASKQSGILPLTIDFTAIPNQSFLSGEITFIWDFDDDSPIQTIKPGDAGYDNKVRYTFNDGTDYFDVKIKVEDSRGFWAENTLKITIADTLQEMIDESGEGSTIRIPAGSYSENLKLWKGRTLIGAGPGSTILEGSIEAYPETRIENFTLRNSVNSAIIATEDAVALSGLTEFYAEIENNVIENAGGYGVFIEPSYTIPFTGFVKNNSITDCDSGGIYIHYLGDNDDGNIVANTITAKNVTSYSPGINIQKDSAGSLIEANTIKYYKDGILIAALKGTVQKNTINENGSGLLIGSTSQSAVIAENIIKDNGHTGILVSGDHYGSIMNNEVTGNESSNNSGGIDLKNVHPGSVISGNTISGNKSLLTVSGGGLHISSFLGGIVSSNIITGNQATHSNLAYGGGVYIHSFESDASFAGNTVSNNTCLHGSGGGVYVNSLEGSFTGNTVTGNTAKINGGGVLISGPATPAASPKIKDSNTISGNSLTAPGSVPKTDLKTPWAGDSIPE
jgi:parallel beta-helix repeat protein